MKYDMILKILFYSVIIIFFILFGGLNGRAETTFFFGIIIGIAIGVTFKKVSSNQDSDSDLETT